MAKEQQQPIQGYDLDLEMAAIERRRLAGEPLLPDSRANVLGWTAEYLLALKVFKNPVKINEKGELVNSKSGVRLADVTSSTERKGKPLEAVKIAENRLANAEEGSMVVIASPAGDSEDHKNRKIHLKYTQLYAFEKREDAIDSVTIVIDNDLHDNQTLIKNLDPKVERLKPIPDKKNPLDPQTEYELACNLSGIAAFVPSENGLHLENLIDEIERARTENNHPLSASLKETLADGIIKRDQNSEELERANRIAALYFDQFEQFFQENEQNLDQEFTKLRVKAELKSTLEKIAHHVEFGPVEVENIIQGRLSELKRRKTYRFLNSLTGCNDFYGGMGSIDGPFGSRLGYFSEVKPQISFMKNGEYYVSINGQEIKGTKCFECNAVTICGPRCFRCGRRLSQAA